jgi:hypothetical protein
MNPARGFASSGGHSKTEPTTHSVTTLGVTGVLGGVRALDATVRGVVTPTPIRPGTSQQFLNRVFARAAARVVKLAGEGSNLQPTDSKSVVLPIELPAI